MEWKAPKRGSFHSIRNVSFIYLGERLLGLHPYRCQVLQQSTRGFLSFLPTRADLYRICSTTRSKTGPKANKNVLSINFFLLHNRILDGYRSRNLCGPQRTSGVLVIHPFRFRFLYSAKTSGNEHDWYNLNPHNSQSESPERSFHTITTAEEERSSLRMASHGHIT